MFKTVKKHGNGRALTVEKSLLDILGIDDKTILKVTTDGKSITFTPVEDQDKHRKKFQNALKDVGERYGEAFKKMPED